MDNWAAAFPDGAENTRSSSLGPIGRTRAGPPTSISGDQTCRISQYLLTDLLIKLLDTFVHGGHAEHVVRFVTELKECHLLIGRWRNISSS